MGRLFELPEYDGAFARFVAAGIDELMRRKDPVLGSIKVVKSPQVSTVRNTMPSGDLVENKPMRVAMQFAVDSLDAIAGSSDSPLASMDSAAEEGLKVIMPQVFAYVTRVCGCGNCY